MSHIRIGNAPCSWGVLEFGLEGEVAGCTQVLNEMVELGYVGTELGRLAFELYSKGEGKTAEEQGEIVNMRKSMAKNAAWAPLTVHWGSDKGLVSELTLSALACVPSVISMRDLWKQTAKA